MVSRVRGALANVSSSRTWAQWIRVANFIGYDAAARQRATIGAQTRISPTASFRNGERISIGQGSHIGQGCMLWAGDTAGRIVLGDHVLLAPRVFLTASNYDVDAGRGPVMDLPRREADIFVGSNTWLGANVVVVAGVTIGSGAIVAAGAVVTQDVPENSIVAGVPARHLRERGSPRPTDT